MFETVIRDIRYAVRALRRSPGFTAVAVLTLGLGIGANTAIFSVVDAVLLKPLAYADPGRLVSLRGLITLRGQTETQLSAPEYRNVRDGLPALSSVAAVWPININLSGTDAPERLQAAVVTSNYFDVLGVRPVLGRVFTPEDAGGRIGYVAVISYELWQRRFGGDRGVIGRVIRLDDDAMPIIGVMPRGFRHPTERGNSPMEVWAPIDLNNTDSNFVSVRRFRPFEVIGRLQPGVSLAQAQAGLDVLTNRLTQEYPNDYRANEHWRASMIPLADRVVGDVRPALIVLLGAVGFVLLIACANVANLALARATSRHREVAIRTALGSSRGRVARQLLTESVVLALMGGVLGVLLASWATSALSELARLYLPRAGTIGLNGSVLAFTALVSIATGVLFGLVPAFQGSRSDVQGMLNDSSRGSAGRGRVRMRAGLVVAEVAIALVLLTGAGLLLRSFAQLVAVEPGFEPSRLLTMQVWLPWPNKPETGRFFTQEQRRAFYDRVQEALRAVPGVRDVALTSRLPLRGRNSARFLIDGRAQAPDDPPPDAELRFVTPNYFATMGIPLLRGEGLPAIGDSAAATTLLVNRTFAEKYFPGEEAVGRVLRFGALNGRAFTIAGVVGDVRQIAPEQPAREEMYASVQLNAGLEMGIVMRTNADPDAFKEPALAAIHGVDPEQPVFALMPMEQLLGEAGAARRFSLLLLSLLAAIALSLAAIGVYGVMSYTMTQRRQEFGIRLALGAVPRDVFGLVASQGMRLVALGLAIGASGAWALSRVLDRQLYGVTARDPVAFLGAAAVLGGVALVASAVPARRAARVDPNEALRYE